MKAPFVFPQKTSEIKTSGLVLSRTNYGEADRILSIITPEGKISAIVKGVRRPKSKLAGGVELFTLSDVIVHFGHGELGIVTSAKMKKHYGNILKDYHQIELTSEILKKVSRVSENSDAPEYFSLVKQSFEALNEGVDTRVVEAWFDLNLLATMGEEPNFYRDEHGEKLDATMRYEWNAMEKAFSRRENGRYGADEIKILRLMVTAELKIVMKVKNLDERMPDILKIVQLMVK